MNSLSLVLVPLGGSFTTHSDFEWFAVPRPFERFCEGFVEIIDELFDLALELLL